MEQHDMVAVQGVWYIQVEIGTDGPIVGRVGDGLKATSRILTGRNGVVGRSVLKKMGWTAPTKSRWLKGPLTPQS